MQFILIALCIAVINATLAYIAWKHPALPARYASISMLLAAAWWLIGAALQIASPEASKQLMWARIQYLVAAIIPTLWLLFALQFAGLTRFLQPAILLGLTIEPVFSILLTWLSKPAATFPAEGILSNGLFTWLVQPPGLGGWIHIIYTISLSIISAILLSNKLIKHRRVSSEKNWVAICAVLIVSIGISQEVLGFNPLSPLPLVPIAIMLAGFLVGVVWIIFHLYGLEPQASQTIFEHISDAVIVLDTSNRVVNLNTAACKMTGCKIPNAIGQPIEKAWPDWPSEVTWPFGTAAVDQDLNVTRRGVWRSFSLHISPLSDSHGRLRGRVIVLQDTTAQKRTKEALHRRDDILDAIGFATRQFMRRAALEEILPDVFARLGEATNVSRVYLLENQTTSEGDTVSIYRHEWDAWRIHPDPGLSVLQTFSMAERGLGRWVDLLSAGSVINDHLRNLPASEQRFLKVRNVRSLVVVPILLEDKWWGSLGFEDCKSEHEWSQIEIDALRTAADTIGGALQRRQAEEAAHRWADLIQTLLDLTIIIGSTLNIQQVLERVVQAIRTLLPVDRAEILLWDEQRNVLLPPQTNTPDASRSDRPANAERDFGEFTLSPEQVPLINELKRRKETIAIQSAPNSALLPTEIIQQLNIRSLLAVPIFYHDRFTAVLYVGYTIAEHIFTQQEINLATALARQAGLAIDRARLYTQSQEDAEELAALYHASSTLFTTGQDIQTLAEKIAEIVSSEFDFSYCSIVLVDKNQNQLRQIAQRGLTDLPNTPLTLDGSGLTVQAALTGEIIYAEDVTKAPHYQPVSTRTRSEIVIPLKAGDEVMALLNLESPRLAAFDQRARRILTAFANDAALAWQNVRLLNTTQGHARQMALLNEITNTALLETDIHEILDIISNRLNGLIQSDHCYITIWDAGRQQAFPLGVSTSLVGLPQHWAPEAWQPSLTAAALAAREPIIVPDTQQSIYFIPQLNGRYPFHTLLGLPMIVGELKLGAVLIGFNQAHTFSEQEISICQQATGQVALAIAKAWSLESARQRAQEAETLRQAGAIVASTLKEDEAIQLIMEQLARVVPCDSASVQILHNGFLEIVGGFGWPETLQIIGLRFPVPGDNPNTQVVQQRQPVLLGDAPQVYPEFLQALHLPIRSWLGVPLILHDQVMGMLTMDSTQPDYFTLDQARLASAFAGQVAIVMENTRLYQQARQAAERRNILHRVSQEFVTANLDDEQIYAAIHRAVEQLMPTEAFTISLVVPDSNQVEIVYLIDKDGHSPDQLTPIVQGLTESVLAASKTIYIPDMKQSTEVTGHQYRNRECPRSALASPLRVGDQIIGILSAQNYQANAYTTEDLYLLEMLATTAAIAIQNSHLLNEIQWLAITDPLTGLYNRRGLFNLAEREVDRYRRFGRPFCVFMLDIDHFKLINDSYGHAAGDQVLVELANRLKQQIRDIDIISRYGGEEIVVVLPETQLSQALQAAERARHTIQEQPFHTDRGDIPVTISVGVVQINATIPDLAALIDRADIAQYAAKQAGRNQVCIYNEEKNPASP